LFTISVYLAFATKHSRTHSLIGLPSLLDNFYYPPDHDPRKGSIHKQQGTHALGVRAKKIKQGIIVVRFELPYNIWCGTCNAHIGKGVRYNAEKSQVGMYHTTKIWDFACKCHLCDGRIVVRTNPKDAEYDVVEGGRRQVQT
jgi:coiled-coil domain-containing protein 130